MPGQTETLYGRHAVLEALRAGRRRVHRVLLGQGVQQTGIIAEIVSVARERGCPVAVAPRPTLDRVGPVNHQGVVAEAAPYPYVDLDSLIQETSDADPIYLALDHLQDVQNLGTLLRTAEAMAVAGVALAGKPGVPVGVPSGSDPGVASGGTTAIPAGAGASFSAKPTP